MTSGPGLGWPGQPDRRGRGAALPAAGHECAPDQAAAVAFQRPAGLGWPADGLADGPAQTKPVPSAGPRSGPGTSTDGPALHGSRDESGPARRMRQALSAAVSRETGADGDGSGTAEMRKGETDMAKDPGQAPADRQVPGGGTPAAGEGAVVADEAPRTAGTRDGSGATARFRSPQHGRRRDDGAASVVVPAAREPGADTPIARAAQAALVARAGGPAWPRPPACRIIAVANQKGGVGKTTTAVNLAASLAMHGCRVLVVDLDPQGNASTALDVDHHTGTLSVYNVLVDDQPLATIIRPVEAITQLYCAPATIDLAGAEIELVPLVARESRLSRALSRYDVSDLDYIVIDCPPSLGLLTVNALVAAPEVLIPIQCEYYALEGLEQLLRTVNLVKSHLNPALGVSTILLTMYDARTRLAAQVADEVREHFGGIVLGSVIPRSVRVSEAPSYGQSVMTYDPGSTGAVAYLEAAKEMAYRGAQAAR